MHGTTPPGPDKPAGNRPAGAEAVQISAGITPLATDDGRAASDARTGNFSARGVVTRIVSQASDGNFYRYNSVLGAGRHDPEGLRFDSADDALNFAE